MLTKFSIKNSVLTISLLVVLVLGGISQFNSMSRDDMPPFLIRYMSVITTYPGASPERVENLITDKVEKVIQEVPEVDYIFSESRTGISIVIIALKEEVYDLQPIFDRMRRKVESVQPFLPSECFVEIDDELGDVFGIIVGLTAEGYTYREMKDIADDIRDELITLQDSAKVEISGDQGERVYVEFNDAKLFETGLTQSRLSDIISRTNIVIPGGEIDVGTQRLSLEPTGNFESIQDLEHIIVGSSQGKVIRLADVATIRRGYEEPKQWLTKINGVDGLAIAVNLKKGGNIISLGRQVDDKLEELKSKYPYGVEFERVASQDEVVEKAVNDFLVNLVQAVAVVLVVMLVFLGLRTGVIASSLIPFAIVTTLMLMALFGLGLNKVTLASLIIALGMLVDNGIVMSESVMVKMAGGENGVDAAISSARELMIPLLTSSVTTSAAFMAFFLARSVMGEIMGNIFVVVSFSLLSSWLMTMTVIALFCAHGMKQAQKPEKESAIFSRIIGYYSSLLLRCLKRPLVTVSVILALFVFSLWLAGRVPVIFMPKSDRPLVTVNLEFPIGTTIDTTEQAVNKIEHFVSENLLARGDSEGVLGRSAYIGQGAPKYDLGYLPPESSPNAAHILLNTTSDEANDPVIEALDGFIFQEFPDVTYRVSRLISGGGSEYPVEVRISGDDIPTLYEISDKVKSMIRGIPGSSNVDDNWGLKTKKIMVDIDTTAAQLAGLTNQDIALSLQTMLSGVSTGTFREGDEAIPIVMINDSEQNLRVEDLENMNIYSQQTGKGVPLAQVASISVLFQPNKIRRRDLLKTITVTSDLEDNATARDITTELIPMLDEAFAKLGRGYSYELGGDAEGSSKAMGAVAEKLPMCFFIIVLVLIGQFNSVKKPLIILLTIPLGLIGVVVGLFITRSYLGFMTFMGTISLSGIIINNAIVLIDRINIEETENKRSTADAIVSACRQRLRPILLTTATTSFGLIPLWLGGGIIWEPMAISIIFGLIFATVLTLVFVPVLYRLFFRVSFKDYAL